MPHLKITEVILVHYRSCISDIVNNDYQQDSKVYYIRFIIYVCNKRSKQTVPNKPFGSLLEISPTNCIFKKHSTQNMMELKYGSQIKIVNH